MATAAGAIGGDHMSIGRVLERSISTIRHNPLVTLGVAFLFGALPTLLVQYLLGTAALESADTGIAGFIIAAGLTTSLLGLVIACISQAALTRATVAEAEGRRASFGETLAAAISVLLPLIGLSILFGLAVMLGMLLLIVPGIILYLMWAVAVPVLVEERTGILGAFGRSRELTRGARWKIFGLILVALVLYWMISAAVGAISLGLYDTGAPIAERPPAALALETVAATLTTAVWATVQASLYVELRSWKDGPDNRDLEEVFS